MHWYVIKTINKLIDESFFEIISGKSQVHWSETETSGRETETVHYQASENYFYHKIQLFAGNNETGFYLFLQ